MRTHASTNMQVLPARADGGLGRDILPAAATAAAPQQQQPPNRDAQIPAALASARQCYDLGGFGQALAVAEAVAAADGTNTHALLLAGAAAYQVGDYARCAALNARALALDGASAECYNNLGNAHAALGDVARAVEAYRAALALKPGFRCARTAVR